LTISNKLVLAGPHFKFPLGLPINVPSEIYAMVADADVFRYNGMNLDLVSNPAGKLDSFKSDWKSL
jgi:hypothetical protein